MKKKIFFLAGLPRAGNTILSCILNQNPKIAVTPNSFLFSLIEKIMSIKEEPVYKNAPNLKNLNNVLKNVYNNFYSSWDQQYIIERSGAGNDLNFNFIKDYIDKEVKIIFMYRPVLEILASFVDWANKNPNNFLHKQYSSNVESICDGLLSPNGLITKNLKGMANLLLPQNKKHVCFIQYEDLVKNSKKTITKIYNFLNIPLYNHTFKNFKQLNVNGIKYDDSILGNNLHTIKTKKISFTKRDTEKILGKNLIKKYSDVKIVIYK